MTNHIFLQGLKVKTKIGVPDWERAVSQELIIDIEIQLKGDHIFNSNDINKTIDYALVEAIIKDISENHQHYLLEPFGEEIITALKKKLSFESIQLKISKQKILPDTDLVGIILKR